ncbi:MAG: hypothetical protein HFJ48_00155 [Clostridia bacterium]|nr:hypothetical protein [Clostridia bacterium]
MATSRLIHDTVSFSNESIRVNQQISGMPQVVRSIRDISKDDDDFLDIMACFVDTSREVIDLVCVYNSIMSENFHDIAIL